MYSVVEVVVLNSLAVMLHMFVFCRDTAGQERYQSITKQYYSRAQVSTLK